MMATLIKNSQILRAVLETAIEEVIREVSDKVSKRLKENINEYTYFFDYYPNQIYYNGTRTATHEFRDKAWTWTDIRKSSNSIKRKLFYDWKQLSKMGSGEDTWKHGSLIEGWGRDGRQYLAENLNIEGHRSSLRVGNRFFDKERRAFWDITIKELFDEGQLEKWLIEGFTKRGLQVSKGIKK